MEEHVLIPRTNIGSLKNLAIIMGTHFLMSKNPSFSYWKMVNMKISMHLLKTQFLLCLKARFSPPIFLNAI